LNFKPVTLTDDEELLRQKVRNFIRQELPKGTFRPGLGMDAPYSPAFSKNLAEYGWVGMAIPQVYGGAGKNPVERFIVVEELLAAGAPVSAHWIADRQTVHTLLRFGTDAQCERFLPAIASGQCFFSIGMSEPDSGSDLASVRTTATKVTEGGWSISGVKIWTTNADLNHFFVVLCRTSPRGDDRHEGLTQLIVDLKSPGVTVNPILHLDGSIKFNEVELNDVFVPDELLLGDVGNGWFQVTSELSYERSGPDRFLSTWPLFIAYLVEHPNFDSRFAEAIGSLTARFWSIRQLSLSIARSMQQGSAPNVEAAMVKDLGTNFEQEVVATIQSLLEVDPDPSSKSVLESLLAESILTSPGFTIRGGTTEVLRSVIAQGQRVTS
jgi:hypothetical protein